MGYYLLNKMNFNPESVFNEEILTTYPKEKIDRLFESLLLFIRSILSRMSVDYTLCLETRRDYIKTDYYFGSAAIFYILEGSKTGYRYYNAFLRQKKIQHNKVILLTELMPEITEDILYTYFSMLDENDIIIGPKLDKDIYLIGISNLKAELFLNLDWDSKKTIVDEIKKFCQSNSVKLSVLDEKKTVYSEQELEKLLKRIISSDAYSQIEKKAAELCLMNIKQ